MKKTPPKWPFLTYIKKVGTCSDYTWLKGFKNAIFRNRTMDVLPWEIAL